MTAPSSARRPATEKQPALFNSAQMLTMTAAQFRSALDVLELSMTDFAPLMDVSRKTVSFWANSKDPVPRSVALYLELRLKLLAIAEQLAGRPLSQL